MREGGPDSVATLHLMVGLPCSGKTTLARALETKCNALRFGLDEWHIRLYGHDFWDGMNDSDERTHAVRHETVESLIWDVATRALGLGVDVVLDFGCWSRSEREQYRTEARKLGAEFTMHFTTASEEILLARLRQRNNNVGDSAFYIPESKLREWMQIFEQPSKEELEGSGLS